MGKCKIRIILTGVLFFDNQIGNKVKDESGVISEPLCEHRTQFVFIDDFLDDDTGADLQAAAPVGKGKFLRDLSIREVYLEPLIRKHKCRILRGHLAHNCPLGHRVFLILIVFAAVLIQDIGRAALLLGDDLALHHRDFNSGIEVHNSSYI